MDNYKLVLYGEPGTGKSVFAHHAPKRFFITTDANYQYLKAFGAKKEDHVHVNSWFEMKNVINDILKGKYDKYETFVVDLVEDAFKWCEYEYCKKNGYEHVSDIGFGKGYDITRNEFFIEISKLLNLEDKNVILISHGITFTVKDRRGIEHTKHAPSSRIPDKVWDMLEGRVPFFLRCYMKAEDIDGKLIKKRYLSIVPKENEFGVARGLNENDIPADIPLDYTTFTNCIGMTQLETKVSEPVKDVIKDVVLPQKPEVQPTVEVKDDPLPKMKPEEPVEVKTTPVVEEVKPEPVPEKVEVVNEAPKQVSTNDKLASILAKLGKK